MGDEESASSGDQPLAPGPTRHPIYPQPARPGNVGGVTAAMNWGRQMYWFRAYLPPTFDSDRSWYRIRYPRTASDTDTRRAISAISTGIPMLRSTAHLDRRLGYTVSHSAAPLSLNEVAGNDIFSLGPTKPSPATPTLVARRLTEEGEPELLFAINHELVDRESLSVLRDAVLQEVRGDRVDYRNLTQVPLLAWETSDEGKHTSEKAMSHLGTQIRHAPLLPAPEYRYSAWDRACVNSRVIAIQLSEISKLWRASLPSVLGHVYAVALSVIQQRDSAIISINSSNRRKEYHQTIACLYQEALLTVDASGGESLSSFGSSIMGRWLSALQASRYDYFEYLKLKHDIERERKQTVRIASVYDFSVGEISNKSAAYEVIEDKDFASVSGNHDAVLNSRVDRTSGVVRIDVRTRRSFDSVPYARTLCEMIRHGVRFIYYRPEAQVADLVDSLKRLSLGPWSAGDFVQQVAQPRSVGDPIQVLSGFIEADIPAIQFDREKSPIENGLSPARAPAAAQELQTKTLWDVYPDDLVKGLSTNELLHQSGIREGLMGGPRESPASR